MKAETLHAALLDAHAARDAEKIVSLYTEAADRTGDIDEEMFFLTHAYVFALEAGMSEAAGLRARLEAAGRI